MAEAVGIAAAAAQFAELLFKAAKLAHDIQAASDSAHMTRRIFQLETFAAIARNFAKSSLEDDLITADILQGYTSTVTSLIEKLSQLRINSADGRRERTKKAVRSLLEKDDIEALFEQLKRDQIALLLHRGLKPNENSISNVTEALNQVLDARLGYANPKSDAEQKFLDGIFVSDPRDDRNALISRKGRHVRGTCAWVTQTPQFRSWHSTDAPSPGLILEGGPGQGKSMMAIFLTRQLEELAKESDNESVIYFFCDNSNARQNNALSIFRCLIWQLCRFRPELLLHGTKELRDRGNNVRHLLEPPSIGVETLWRIFRRMIMDEKAGTISCVIDGLDECDEESIFLVLDKLHELAARADSDSTKHGFRFIILSRPHVAGQKLPQLGVTLPKVRLDHDWKKNVHSDIRTFIDKQVDDLASASPDNHWPAPLREQVATILHEKAGGTFLWVGFVTQDLRRKTPMEVKECLKTLPVGLNGIYDRILSRVPPQHRQAVRSILQWVCFAQHPLTPTELAGLFDEQALKSSSQSAMDSDSGSDSDSDGNNNTALNEASVRGTVSRLRDLLRFCNHFVLLVKKFNLDNGDVETVHLVHQSAKDYLTRRDENGESGVDYFRLGKRRAIHTDLGRRCINILTQMIDSNRQEGIPPTNSIRGPNDNTTEQPKPYSYTSEDYAALFWARHLRHGGDDYHPDMHAQILRIISQDKASRSVWAWQASPNPLLGMHSFHSHKTTREEKASALTRAIALGLSSTVKVLVSGMTVEDYTSIVRSSSGGLLNLALDLRHMRIFEILIEAIGSPALILEPNVIPGLADQKSLEVLQRLLKMVKNSRVIFGAELEYCLHKAVFHDSESTFTLLLDAGADPMLADIAYPLAPALVGGRSLDSQQQKKPVLFERLRSLGLLHVNKGYRNAGNTGVTLLHQAASNLDTHMVRALIDAGSRPDAVNSSGQLPLHSAVSTPRLYMGTLGLNAEFVDLLVNATRTDAHIGDHPGLVDSKATSRSLVNFRDNDGFTALHHAADVVCGSWLDALLGRGADVDVLDNFGRTPLLVLLDKRYGKPMQPTERGFSCWDIMNFIAYRMVPCTKILRKAGANGNKQDSRGRSPFHCLAEMMASLPRSPRIHLSFGGGFRLRDSLLEFDIDLDLRDKQGRVARDIYPVEWFWE